MTAADKFFDTEGAEVTGFARPVLDLSRARMENLHARLAESKMGRKLLDVFSEKLRGNELTVVARFDEQMQTLGVCWPGKKVVHIFLDPRADDDMLAAALVHELRHALQPLMGSTHYMPMSGFNRMFYSRVVEGDAFVHQVVYGLEHAKDTGDYSIANANAKYFTGKLWMDQRRTYADICQNYLRAQTDNEKRDCLNQFFWIVQEQVLSSYDAENLEDLPKIIEQEVMRRGEGTGPQGRALPPARENAMDICVTHLMNLKNTPDVMGLEGWDHYLGDDDADTAVRIVAAIKPDILGAVQENYLAAERLNREKPYIVGQNLPGLTSK